MSSVGRLVGLDCAFSGAPAAGLVEVSLLVRAALASAWSCWGGAAGLLSAGGEGVGLPWFEGGCGGALASEAACCELGFAAKLAGPLGGAVSSVLGAGEG